MGMNANKTVILAGASGVFGREVVRILRDAGHEVLGLGRGPTNELRADLMDGDAVLRAVRGLRADVVVHAATALRRPPMSHKGMYPTDDLRIGGTTHLLAAARAVGADRFIGENIVLGYGYRDFGERPLTEADPFAVTDPDRRFDRHLEGMREKERRPIDAGLDAISLRYGGFYGGEATQTIVDLLRRRRLPAFDDRGRVAPWIHLTDAATAVLAAIDHGRPGQAYNIADESRLGLGGMIRAVAAAFGTPKPLTVPIWLTAVSPFLHRITAISMRVDTAKARDELGWKPAYPTVGDGLRAMTGRDSLET
jgi:nucleoside-diphosphate-sugar epimerase